MKICDVCKKKSGNVLAKDYPDEFVICEKCSKKRQEAKRKEELKSFMIREEGSILTEEMIDYFIEKIINANL